MSILNILNPVAALRSYINYKADRLRLKKLMGRGLKVGRNVYIMEQVEFDSGYPFLIEIHDNCRISKGVRVLAHDATTFRDLGITRVARVRLLEGTFIGERAVILPGVTIGPRTLIASGSIVNRDIGPDQVAAGNPARPYGTFSDLLKRYKEMSGAATIFKKDDIEAGLVRPDDIIAALEKEGTAFIRGVPREDPYYVNADYSEMRSNAERVFNEMMAQKK